MKPLGVALIGCGGIAQSAHLPALAALGERARIVSAMDVNGAAAEAVGRTFGAFPTTSLEAALDQAGVEAAVVCTPEFQHREAVAAAAARGLHVLCEKPMAPSLEDADAMIAVCRKAGVQLMIAHSRRFTRRYIELRRAVLAGEVGEVRMVRENERRPRPPAGAPGTYWTRAHWTGDPALSVGAILTNGIHEADLFNWFIGARPLSVYAEARITRPDGAVPDFISFLVRYENGAIGASEVNNSAPPGYPGFHEFELFGTSGMVRARDHEMRMMEDFGEGGMRYPQAYEQILHVQHAYTAEHAAFIDALRSGSALPVRAEEARMALAVGLAAAASARSGRPEPVDAGTEVAK